MSFRGLIADRNSCFSCVVPGCGSAGFCSKASLGLHMKFAHSIEDPIESAAEKVSESVVTEEEQVSAPQASNLQIPSKEDVLPSSAIQRQLSTERVCSQQVLDALECARARLAFPSYKDALFALMDEHAERFDAGVLDWLSGVFTDKTVSPSSSYQFQYNFGRFESLAAYSRFLLPARKIRSGLMVAWALKRVPKAIQVRYCSVETKQYGLKLSLSSYSWAVQEILEKNALVPKIVATFNDRRVDFLQDENCISVEMLFPWNCPETKIQEAIKTRLDDAICQEITLPLLDQRLLVTNTDVVLFENTIVVKMMAHRDATIFEQVQADKDPQFWSC